MSLLSYQVLMAMLRGKNRETSATQGKKPPPRENVRVVKPRDYASSAPIQKGSGGGLAEMIAAALKK